MLSAHGEMAEVVQPTRVDIPDVVDLDAARRLRDLIDGYPEVLTPREAAVLLRTSTSTMGRLIRLGQVPATKVGGRWRLLKSALLDSLADRSRA